MAEIKNVNLNGEENGEVKDTKKEKVPFFKKVTGAVTGFPEKHPKVVAFGKGAVRGVVTGLAVIGAAGVVLAVKDRDKDNDLPKDSDWHELTAEDTDDDSTTEPNTDDE